jgi:hypothetical protein
LHRLRRLAEEAEAAANAARELAEFTRRGDLPNVEALDTAAPQRRASAAGAARAQSKGEADRFTAEYALLGMTPGGDLEALETAYQARLGETRPERHPAGSAERRHAEAERREIVAAYERLRDALNPTETRFEKLEF